MSAVLITGGFGLGTKNSAEVYHPDRDTPCVLRDLPDQRVHHTQDGSLVCGGRWTLRSCQKWNPDTGGWDLVIGVPHFDRFFIGHENWPNEVDRRIISRTEIKEPLLENYIILCHVK